MYVPAPFAEDRAGVLHAFIRQNPLGTVITAGAAGLEASHIPLFLDTDRNALRCHVARANPQSVVLADAPEVLVIFTGPQHYITPSWYPSKAEHGRVVPTWNYAAVHVRGRARAMSDSAELFAHLRELTDANEAAFETPWRIDDAPPPFLAALASSIAGFEIAIASVEGKFKLSQNRPEADREGVIHGLEAMGSRSSLTLAELMNSRRGD